jgi:selenocysteine-specific elongation factor
MRVVATAGHVDHGKSTLVLALTGTDPDRFPEEKARGLTIDLGFAFCTLPSGRDIGFVDVPGHSRFVKNMLAGVGAVDVAMLVVAANEGWKPQSEEHLHILDLLAVDHGVVALTKADTVDVETLDLARLEVEEHLVDTSLAGWEIVTCDGRSGRGLDDLRAALDRALADAPTARDDARPRLWIDRVFAAKGAGTVVTGTLTGGTIAVGDELVAGGRPVRVRAIEQHGDATTRVAPGARVALNLAGVDHTDLGRGDAVVRAGQWLGVDVADGAITLLPGARIVRRARLTAAVGSGEHHVWCRPLAGGFARLHFDVPVPIAPGDRVVLRDPGSETTVAGFEILDVTPSARAADAPARLVTGPGARVLAAGWVPTAGLDARTGRAPDAARALLLTAGGEEVGDWIVDGSTAADAREQLRTAVAAHRADHPEAVGLPIGDAARVLAIDPARATALAATEPTVAVTYGCIRAVDHAATARASDAGRELVATTRAGGFAPPGPADPALARALVREGALVEIDGIHFAPEVLAEARDRIVAALVERGPLTIADARDVLGSTRKFVVPIMNHLDATGVTRRRGDVRIAGPRAAIPG